MRGKNSVSEALTITDYVRFLMPDNDEYRFAAVTAVQKFVNTFEIKSVNSDVSEGRAKYALEYELSGLDDRYLQFLVDIGLHLRIPPCRALSADATMVCDMRDARLETFRGLGRHAAQVCALSCAVEAPVLPEIKRVVPSYDDTAWLTSPTIGQLLNVEDRMVCGVVGFRGPETYLAAAMGLGGVELDHGRGNRWLTKWRNPLYRRVVLPDGVTVPGEPEEKLVEAAKASVAGSVRVLRAAKRSVLE